MHVPERQRALGYTMPFTNLNQIREIYREGPLDGSVVLLNGQTVRMSKAGRQKLNEIGKISGEASTESNDGFA